MYKLKDIYLRAEVTERNDGRYGLIFKNNVGEVIYDFPYVSSDILFVSSIADKCNRGGLCQSHVLDVMEDMLG